MPGCGLRGHGEITREHRFIYEALMGVSAQHVHHKNGNKLDNRIENLEGLTASEHTSQHTKARWTEEEKVRHSLYMKEQFRLGNRKLEWNGFIPEPQRGSEHPSWLGRSKEWVEKVIN